MHYFVPPSGATQSDDGTLCHHHSARVPFLPEMSTAPWQIPAVVTKHAHALFVRKEHRPRAHSTWALPFQVHTEAPLHALHYATSSCAWDANYGISQHSAI